MSRAAELVREYKGNWYLVTPALPEPKLVTPDDWFGPPWEVLREWATDTPDDLQEAQLRALWGATCEWCEAMFVDEVEIEGAANPDSAVLARNGFARKVMFSLRQLPVPWSVHWSFSGEPTATASVLRSLRGQTGLSLVGRAQGVERLRLRDNSWDGVYLNIEGLDAVESSDRLVSILRRARATER